VRVLAFVRHPLHVGVPPEVPNAVECDRVAVVVVVVGRDANIVAVRVERRTRNDEQVGAVDHHVRVRKVPAKRQVVVHDAGHDPVEGVGRVVERDGAAVDFALGVPGYVEPRFERTRVVWLLPAARAVPAAAAPRVTSAKPVGYGLVPFETFGPCIGSRPHGPDAPAVTG
jgi:hypothetical protein